MLLDLLDIRGAAARLAGRVRDAASVPVRVPLHMPVRQIHGHIYTTRTETRGVYLCGDTRWSNQPAGTQADVVTLQTAVYAALAGRHIRIRAAGRPVDPWPWAHQHAEAAHPARAAHEQYVAHIEAAAYRQLGIPLTAPVVTVDVRLCGAVDGQPGEGWETQDGEIAGQLTGDGLCAVRAPAGLIDWLIHTSVAPGHPAPPPVPGRACDDMDAFTAEVEWVAPLGARMVQVSAWRVEDGEYAKRTRHVAALRVSTITARQTPGPTPPWMSAYSRAPFPVQLAVGGDIISARDAAAMFQNRAGWQADHIAHLRKHGLGVPDTVQDSHDDAVRLADELVNGDPTYQARARFAGVLVVWGDTPGECMDRVRDLKTLYRDDVRVALELADDQLTALGELCPGVHQISHGYQRTARVSMLAAGVVNVTGVVGQGTGMHWGYTSGALAGRRVLFDPWFPSEELGDAPIYPVLGDPGAGRSTIGMRVIQECVLAGYYAVGIDPAGEWAVASQLDGADGRVQIVDLSADTPETAGLLSITRIIPDPDPDVYRDADGAVIAAAYGEARQRVQALRTALAVDAMRNLVDGDTWANEARREALKDAAADSGGDLWVAIDWLERSDRDGGCEGNRRLARELTTAAYGPGRLLFPPRGVALAKDTAGRLLDAQVVIITMQGMMFPAPSTAQEHWTSDERAAALAMRFAAFLARRLIEEQDRRERRCRKALIIDEASWLANWVHGQTWVQAFIRHVRRWNTAVFLMSQAADDLVALDPTGKAFAAGGFVGCTKDPGEAEKSLKLVHATAGLGEVCKTLSWVQTADGPVKRPGEFLMRDAQGRIERVRVDLDPFPTLARVANTTPVGVRSHTGVAQMFEETVADRVAVG